jgi:hypothetical protein
MELARGFPMGSERMLATRREQTRLCRVLDVGPKDPGAFLENRSRCGP